MFDTGCTFLSLCVPESWQLLTTHNDALDEVPSMQRTTIAENYNHFHLESSEDVRYSIAQGRVEKIGKEL